MPKPESEIIKAIYDRNGRICINKSSVPADKLSHPRLAEYEFAMIAELSTRTPRRWALCGHEAAHEVFYRATGIKTTWQGPEIFYNPENEEDPFEATAGSVFAVRPFTSPVSRDQIAKCLAAGGVFQKLHTNCTDADIGDGLDFREFHKLCLAAFPFAECEIQKSWDDAKISVTKDLRRRRLRKEIWDTAGEFEQAVFGYNR